MKNFFYNKKIAITGSKGFVASHVILELKKYKLKKLKLLNSKNLNYNKLDDIVKKIKGYDYLIHLSSATGGINYSKNNKSYQFYNSLIKDLNIFEAARLSKIKKVITLSNLHAYPSRIKGKLKEKNIFEGLPNKIHLSSGWPKRTLPIMTEIYGDAAELTNFIVLISANTYGPNDSTNINYSHIIPSTIMKFLNGKKLTFLGGKNSQREFIYVKDLAKIILHSLFKVKTSCYFNVGTNHKIKIIDLINKIKKITKNKKKLIFLNKIKDNSIRISDTKIMQKKINYKIEYSIDQGLLETVNWYKKNIKKFTN